MAGSPERIAVFGARYVGLVTGACFADLGHTVVVRDVVEERVGALRRGEVPIYEPGLDELIARNSERLTFTTDVAEAVEGANVVYVAVGTTPTNTRKEGKRRKIQVKVNLGDQIDPKLIVVQHRQSYLEAKGDKKN